MSMAIVTVAGYLSGDAEMRYTPKGTAVVNFSIPVDTFKDGEKATEWYKIAFFGERAEKLLQYLKKGKFVTVVGTLSHGSWTGQDGSSRTSIEVKVSEIALGPGGDEEKSARQQTGQAATRQPAKKPSTGQFEEEEIDIPVA